MTINNSLKIKIINDFLSGIKREDIAKKYEISTGSVSAIAEEFEEEIPDIHKIRAMMVKLNAAGDDPKLFYSAIRLHTYIQNLGLTEAKAENILEIFQEYAFKGNYNISELFDAVIKAFNIAQEWGTDLEHLDQHVNDKEKVLEAKEARIRKLNHDIEFLPYRLNIDLVEFQEYQRDKPIFQKFLNVINNKRVEIGEISTETIKNYFKPIKRFFEMNRITLNWKIISKGIKKGIRYSNDRPPTIEEIRKLIQYPDLRVKPIVLVMISSRIRVSSWSYLTWGDFTPIYKNEKLIAAKLKVFNTKTNNYYYSYVTPEAYESVKEWMIFRESFGEKISRNSCIIRNRWQIKSQRYGNYLGLARHPKRLSATGIRVLINDAWKIQGLREKRTPKEGEFNFRKYDFKSVHGFRKFFETECQKVMR